MNRLRDQQSPEVFHQSRPRKRVHERCIRLIPRTQQQDVSAQSRRNDEEQRESVEQHADERHRRREKAVRVKRGKPEEQIHSHKPVKRGFLLHFTVPHDLHVQSPVFRRDQIVRMQEIDQFKQLRLITVQTERVDPRQKFAELVTAVHQLQNPTGTLGKFVIRFGQRIENHCIVAMFSGGNELDVRTDHSGAELRLLLRRYLRFPGLLRSSGSALGCDVLFHVHPAVIRRDTREPDCGRGNIRV